MGSNGVVEVFGANLYSAVHNLIISLILLNY